MLLVFGTFQYIRSQTADLSGLPLYLETLQVHAVVFGFAVKKEKFQLLVLQSPLPKQSLMRISLYIYIQYMIKNNVSLLYKIQVGLRHIV